MAHHLAVGHTVHRETLGGCMPPERDVVTERAFRKHELAIAYRLFGAHRWGELGDGHITARDPERTDCMWLVRGGVAFDRVMVDDLILVGPDGTLIEGDGHINISAFYIHHPIHAARPDAIAAAHTHTQWGTPFSTLRRTFEPIVQEACLFWEDHSLFDDEEVDIVSLDGGKRIAASLADNRSVILANHGLLTVGDSVAACVGAFVTMERVAEAHMKAPDAIAISPAAAEMAKRNMHLGPVFENTFDFLVHRHVHDPTVVD